MNLWAVSHDHLPTWTKSYVCLTLILDRIPPRELKGMNDASVFTSARRYSQCSALCFWAVCLSKTLSHFHAAVRLVLSMYAAYLLLGICLSGCVVIWKCLVSHVEGTATFLPCSVFVQAPFYRLGAPNQAYQARQHAIQLSSVTKELL